jgi:hypothetical protein
LCECHYYHQVYRGLPVLERTLTTMAQTLNDFVDYVGIPDTLVCDLTPKYVGPNTEFMKEIW